jgi:hypothetical protein
MDIQGLSMDMAQSKLADQVGVSMLAKSLRGIEEQGADLVKLLEPAPLAAGSGSKIDLFA